MPKTNQNKYKTATIVLAATLAIVTLASGFALLKRQNLSLEEQQRLEIFETLASSYINEEFFGPICFDIDKNYTYPTDECKEPNYNRTAVTTGFGMTKDNDVYANFTISYYSIDGDHDKPAATRDGRLHFQKDEERDDWAFAYSYEDLKRL